MAKGMVFKRPFTVHPLPALHHPRDRSSRHERHTTALRSSGDPGRRGGLVQLDCGQLNRGRGNFLHPAQAGASASVRPPVSGGRLRLPAHLECCSACRLDADKHASPLILLDLGGSKLDADQQSKRRQLLPSPFGIHSTRRPGEGGRAGTSGKERCEMGTYGMAAWSRFSRTPIRK